VLTRFLKGKSHFSVDKRMIKQGAFVPPPDRRLSCFRIGSLGADAIWRLADENKITTPSGRPVDGRADLPLSSVAATAAETRQPIQADLDDLPPRHVSIFGWPEDKDAQMIVAQSLCRRATLVLRADT
jgi:hypothetical protein